MSDNPFPHLDVGDPSLFQKPRPVRSSQAQHMMDNAPAIAGIRPTTIEEELQDVDPFWTKQRAGIIKKEYDELKGAVQQRIDLNPKGKEEEMQKAQLSFYVADRLRMEPSTVYKAWDGLGGNAFVEKYFNSVDLPETWWRNMKSEVARSFHSYKAINMGAAMAVQPYNPDTVQAMIEELKLSQAKPGHMTDSGPVFNLIKRLPQQAMAQLPMLADIGVTEVLAGGAAALTAGLIAGPEVMPGVFAGARRIAGVLSGAKIGVGQVMTEILGAPDPETGKPAFEVVTDKEELFELARKAAAIAGVITGPMMMVGVESVGGALARNGAKILTKAGEAGTFKTFASQMLKKYGKNVGTQITMMDMQGVINEAFKSDVLGQINEKRGTKFKTYSFNDLARKAIEDLPGALESSVLIAIPGSFAEARASFKHILVQRRDAKAKERLAFIDKVADTARPYHERQADIQARLAQLAADQQALDAKIDASLKEGKHDEAAIKDHKLNEIEIGILDWQAEEQKIKKPGQPWQGKRGQEETVQPSARETPAEAPAEPTVPLRSTAEAVPWKDPYAEFKGLTAEQITPEVRRRLKDVFFKDPEGRRILTADELNQYPGIAFSGGGAGSGKTELVRQGGQVVENRVLVNMDLFQEMTGLTDKAWKETAREIADELLQEAIDRGYHVTYDSPFYDPDKIEGLIQKAFAQKGAVSINYSFVDPDTSISRQEIRERDWKEQGQPIRTVSIEGTAKGWNRSLPTFIEFFKKYKDDPRVRFNLQDNRTDNAEPYEIIRNSTILDQKALDELLSTEYIEKRGEKGERYYTRTDRSAESPGSLEGREHAARHRGALLHSRGLQPLPPGPGQAGARESTSEPAQLSAPDLSPTSPTVSTIREALPHLTVDTAQGMAMFAKLLAINSGWPTLDAFMRDAFIKGVFDPSRAKDMEAQGRRGAVSFEKTGKAIYWSTTHTDFGNWIHEMTHVYERILSVDEAATIAKSLGFANPFKWDKGNRETYANTFLAYIREGNVPSEDLRPLFDKFARALHSIYSDAQAAGWKISPEIIEMYDGILAGETRTPKDHPPESIGLDEKGEIIFETRQGEDRRPEDLGPEDFLRQTDFHAAWAAPYFSDAQRTVPSGASSRTTPAPDLQLVVGSWMIDDGYKGIHGHEIAQLREMDPKTLQLNEPDYTQGIAWGYPGRETDAERYAEWMKAGSTPPPITVMETQKGSLLVSDGHRRVAAAKMAGMPVLAWVWPAMDHPEGLHLNSDPTMPVMRVGLTYEEATGRVWEGDQAAEQQAQMLYETRPVDKDPWILKSRAVIREKMKGPQPAENVRKMLEAGGVKAEEMEWLGLNDLLKGNKKISPQEILDYIAAHEIKVQEVVLQEIPQDVLDAEIERIRQDEVDRIYSNLSDKSETPFLDYRIIEEPDPSDGTPSFALLIDGRKWENYPTEEEAQAEATHLEDQVFSEHEAQIYSQAEDRVSQAMSRNDSILFAARGTLKKKYPVPAFQKYNLPGAEQGYRELLMTLPQLQGNKGAWIATDPKTGERAQANTYGEMSDYRARGWKIEDAPEATTPAYQSPHWSEKNVLLHLRFDERTSPEGKRILFVEEIQSDWHQAGKREGYDENARPPELGPGFTVRRITADDVTTYDMGKVGEWGLFDSDDEMMGRAPATHTEQQAREDFARDAEAVGVNPADMGGRKVEIPNAPFKKTWPELGFRRALRWAAENGFDEVAWTTGEQQAERYDLSKQVDLIEVTKERDGSFGWEAWKGKERVAEQGAKDAQELASQIGKDLAAQADQQRANGDTEQYRGTALKVGGEGMKAFYDRQLVEIAKKIAKKYGAEVRMSYLGNKPAPLTERINDRLQELMDDGTERASPGAARILGFIKDEGKTYEEALAMEHVFDERSANLIDSIVDDVRKDPGPDQVHTMTITPEMRESVMEGQMLFEPGPHEESVRHAVEKGWPVPDEVLAQYADRSWAKEEAIKRENLSEAARTVQTFDEFYDWQERSHPDQHLSEDYYQNIYTRAKETIEPKVVTDRKFIEAMDDETIRYTIGGFALVNQDQNPEAQKQLTKEMQELGRRVVAGEDAGDLYEKVREQIAAEPERWRMFLDRYLPDETRAEFETSMDAVDLIGFHPVLPKVANERFTDSINTREKMEDFLRTVGSEGFKGRSKFLARLAEKLEASDEGLEALRNAQAMREVRRDITSYREAYAIATKDEMMLRQLDAELERAAVTEEARLLTENKRLRSELKKSVEAVHQTALRQMWTQADVEKQRKANTELQARYDLDIKESKQKLRESVQKVRKELLNKNLITHVIETELWKRHMREVKKTNAKELAVLKLRVKQAKELARKQVKTIRDAQLIEKYSQYINRPVNAGIADDQARLIEDYQRRITYDSGAVSKTVMNKLREWRRQNPNAAMPSALVRNIEQRDPKLITAGEMRQIYDEVKALRTAGRRARIQQLMAEREFIDNNITTTARVIQGGRKPKDLKGLGTKGSLRETKTGIGRRALWATWRMNRIAEMMDGGKPGPNTHWLWRYVNDATDETLRRVEGYSQENMKIVADLKLSARLFGKQENIDGLTLTHSEMVGVYIYSQFDDGRFALVEDNKISEASIVNIIKAMSPEEKRYGDWMIEHLSSTEDFDRLQAVQMAVSNNRMDRQPRYFPVQRQGMSGSPMLSDLAKDLLEMAGKTAKARPRQGFLSSKLERVPGISFPEMRLDAPAIYMDHINKREFYIANAQLIKRMNRIFDSRAVKAAMADRYGDAMQPLVQKYISNYTNPNIYRAVEDYGDFARILRGNIGMSLIGSNVMTILKQLPDIPQIMIQAGPIDAMRAAAQFIASPRKTLEAMWEKAPQMKQRSYDRFIEELKGFDRNTYERIIHTVGEAGFAALKAMDTVTNVIGWTAVYNKEMRKTGNDNLASQAARDFILRKRPAARAKDVAAIYRNTGLSWFLMFTNQQNQQWNILTYDIPQAFRQALHGNGAAMIDCFMNVTALAVGAVAMGVIARKGVMTAVTTAEDLLNMMFGNTPFIGNAFEAAIRGQPEQNALNPFSGAYQLGKVLFDVANQAETAKVMRDLRNVLFTAGGTLGFPAIQAKRIYRTIESGDPWDFVGGPPKRPKEE